MGKPNRPLPMPAVGEHIRRRRNPGASREALITAGFEIFNQVGYLATNSNAIAREAGYSPGTFYTHFADKLELFLVVHERWVDAEWAGIRSIPVDGSRDSALLGMLVGIKSQHTKFREFRISLRVLSALEPRVRQQRQVQRERQIDWMIGLCKSLGAPRPPKIERCMIALLSIENVMDAFATKEIDTKALRENVILKALVELLRCLLFQD